MSVQSPLAAMPRIALVQVVYNSLKFIPHVYPAVKQQTYKDFEFHAVIAGNDDGSKEYIQEHFPWVKITDPGYNIGFARGHNEIFSTVDAEYFQLVNPDLILAADFVEKMLEPSESERVAAVGGKLLQFDFNTGEKQNTIDSTGVIIRKSGRALDRGQHEPDTGQYDNATDLMAVSGAGALYSRNALEDVKSSCADGRYQYFDERFHSYFEDVDLCWRLYNRGWNIRYQPTAVAWHGRGVASSEGGYSRVLSYIQHRKDIPLAVRKLTYRNHLSLFLKNSPRLYLRFFGREFFYHLFVLLTEPRVLTASSNFLRDLPALWRERKQLKEIRQVNLAAAERLLQ